MSDITSLLLIGLVKKNGIMMVDFALEAQRNQGMSPREAIHRAALLRFRPILMTTLAALFGARASGQGTFVDSAMLDGSLALQPMALASLRASATTAEATCARRG